jgi:hypothetical protein
MAQNQTLVDERILRYLVIDSKMVYTTALPGNANSAQYIYVKPGMFDAFAGISNIDFVKIIYAEHGINLKKHKSHLDGKEVEVLFISFQDSLKLTDEQGEFLSHTAPLTSRDEYARHSEIINKILEQRRMLKR